MCSATRIDPIMQKADADYIFLELTRSICPECKITIDAQVISRDNKIYLRKRCPDHGFFEALVYADAEAYTAATKLNKPGSIPLHFSTEVVAGCPHDCGLCPDHQQHACVGIIEVNCGLQHGLSALFCGRLTGFNLSLEDVQEILDDFIRAEGNPQVVQFSGGEPTIHHQIIPMIEAAQARGIPHVMINTNGKRIANDDRFVEELARVRPSIYFQFDGFDSETYRIIRAEPDILPEKLRALDRLAAIGCDVVLVPAIERGVNEHEIGRIVEFGLQHPAVRGINFQPAFHAGRHDDHDPLQRMTIPDVLRGIEGQTAGQFLVSDFVPIPCCFPTCNSVTYAYVDDGVVTPLPRLLDVNDYLDYIANRVLPDIGTEIKTALEGLWSTSAMPGSPQTLSDFAITCAACGLPDGLDISTFADKMFMIMLQDFMDPWTFNQKNVMKCCKEFLLPGGIQVPFCAYNSVGYREQAKPQLMAHDRNRNRARRDGTPFEPAPITFDFTHLRGSSRSGGKM